MNAAMAGMTPQYRHQYQQQQRMQQTPHKRGAPPIAGPPRNDERAKAIEQAQIASREAEEAKRRSRIPTDKNMPDGVAELIVGDGVQQYNQIRAAERKLDTIMMRRRLDIADPQYSPIKRRTLLKVWISNTVENQPWQGSTMDENAFDFNMGVEPTYRVKLEGRIIEDQESSSDDDEEATGEADAAGDAMQEGDSAAPEPKPEQSPSDRPKFSHLFKQITIDFDRNSNLQPDGMAQIDWTKKTNAPMVQSPEVSFDVLEFERKSDENINCTINLYRDQQPEVYKLKPKMSKFLDATEMDREGVVTCIWDYVQAMGLQQDDEMRKVRCDDRMRDVFESDSINFSQLGTLITPHLEALPPISLKYTIRCNAEYNSVSPPIPTIYLLTLPSTSNYRQKPTPPSSNYLGSLQDISKYDKHLALLIQALASSKNKHAFLTSMAKDPVGFTKRWMASQSRDLEIVLGEGGRFAADEGPHRTRLRGEWTRAGHWKGREIEEAAKMMVGKKHGDRMF